MPETSNKIRFLPLILVVDHTETCSPILSSLLGQEYRLKFAKNGEEALALASTAEMPDLILLDTVLPDFDCDEIFRQLQETPNMCHTPIIFVGYEDSISQREKALKAGGVDYITNPLDPQKVLVSICSYLPLEGSQDKTTVTVLERQVRDDERKRLSREIHDELGQLLSALRMQVSGIELRGGPANDMPDDRLKFISTLVEKAQTATQDIVSGLRSPAVDLNLVSALQWQVDEFVKNSGVACDFSVSNNNINLEHEHTLALTRIVQEALTNVMRYAEATEVEVKLSHLENHLILVVRDNGVGFDVGVSKEEKQSFGLVGIQERTQMMGGVAKVDSRPGHGTLVNAIIPI